MEKCFGRGELLFSLVLSVMINWNLALTFTRYTRIEWATLGFSLCLTFLVVALLLWLITTCITHRPLFGTNVFHYYPFRQMLILAMVICALFGGINYLHADYGTERAMTTSHILTYAVGYVVSVIVLMGYFYFLTKPKKNKD